MKKRTVFTVLLAMVFALSFAWTAMAADDACVDCGKCPLGQIGCCEIGLQGSKTATYFDYDSRCGYCDPTPNPNCCKVIFDLCECDDPNTNFQSGKPIGIHMTILTTGVYFTDDSVCITAYTSKSNACKGMNPYSLGCYSSLTYYDRDDNEVDPMSVSKAYEYDCEVPCDAYAVELVADSGIPLPEVVVTGGWSYWWVNLPKMVLNWSEIQGREGEVVKVEVCLQGTTGGICRDCRDICCCIVELGTLCCEEGDQTCIYFPYVVTQVAPWWTGICITNVGGNASLDLTMTMTDQNGNTFVWQKDDHTVAVWTFMLDSVLGNFVGTGTPAPGPAMIRVQSNEGFIDGYSFLTDGTFGGSTLARGCCPLCLFDAATVKAIKEYTME